LSIEKKEERKKERQTDRQTKATYRIKPMKSK